MPRPRPSARRAIAWGWSPVGWKSATSRKSGIGRRKSTGAAARSRQEQGRSRLAGDSAGAAVWARALAAMHATAILPNAHVLGPMPTAHAAGTVAGARFHTAPRSARGEMTGHGAREPHLRPDDPA